MGVAVTVNGRSISLAGIPLHSSALDLLRAHGLTGAKDGCGEGECGACAVLVARPGATTPTQWVAQNSCLMPAAGLAGLEVVTVEGLGAPGNLHPVQRELARRGGSQCGYCTPGFVCAMAAEYYRPGRGPVRQDGGTGAASDPPASAAADPAAGDPAVTSEQPGAGEPPLLAAGPNGFDLDALGGNLCRCTGYRPIRDAAFALGLPDPHDPMVVRCARPAPRATPFRAQAAGAAFIRPADLDEALAILAAHPEAIAVAGTTDWGVEANLRGARAPIVVAIDQLAELREFAIDDTGVTIGAALTLTEVDRRLAGRVPLIAQLVPRFASRLVRNAATLGGNLATASPIGDSAPVLLALDARLVLTSAAGERIVAADEFFTAYRRTVLGTGELIRAIRIPLPLARLVRFEKVSKRPIDDISSVSVAIAVDIAHGRVRSARIGLGGVAATPIRGRATEEMLIGQEWDERVAREAAATLATEGSPIDDLRASARYRSAMLAQSLIRLGAAAGGRTGR